jgi:hypothetical protein
LIQIIVNIKTILELVEIWIIYDSSANYCQCPGAIENLLIDINATAAYRKGSSIILI